MSSKRAYRNQAQESAGRNIPQPSTHLIAQADATLRLCGELEATREKIRRAEQAYRLAQRTLAEAEHNPRGGTALVDAVEAAAVAKEMVAAAEKEMIQQRRRLPAIESKISQLHNELSASVASIVGPMRAQAAQNFRNAISRAKVARDEFVGAADVTGAPVESALLIAVRDLESGNDLMYGRPETPPEFVRQWWPIRLALRAAQRSYSER